MMLFRRFILLLVLLMPLAVLAQRELIRSGEYTYYVPDNVSLEKAKEIALIRAQMQVLAEAFGTKIEQRNHTSVSNVNGLSEIDFQSFSESELGGEWISDVKAPQYRISYDQDMLVVNCRVSGCIRQIKQAKIIFDAKVLRNGADDCFESQHFKHNDDLFISFRSPISGYLAVYLCDNENNVVFLAPYDGCEDDRIVIKARKRYVLYSSDHPFLGQSSVYIRNYTMTCTSEYEELNKIYIIFSPNPFANADYQETQDGLHLLDYQTFQSWLGRNRRQDPQLAIKTITISIKK